jgi:membrane-associated protease RseP (regulator of RpoE activity)
VRERGKNGAALVAWISLFFRLMRTEVRPSKWFAALHLAIVSALVLAEVGGFVERIVPRFTLPPTAEPVRAQTMDQRSGQPFDGVKFTPESQEGEPVGLRLSGVAGQGLFAKLGLRDGDRLDRVGGYRVTNPNDLIALYAKLRALDVLKLLIERDGRPMTITIHLR